MMFSVRGFPILFWRFAILAFG